MKYTVSSFSEMTCLCSCFSQMCFVCNLHGPSSYVFAASLLTALLAKSSHLQKIQTCSFFKAFNQQMMTLQKAKCMTLMTSVT